MRTITSLTAAFACAGTLALAQAQRPADQRSAARQEPAPQPVQMTITGCLYEVSPPQTTGNPPGISPAQTTLYVLRDVDEAPEGRPADRAVGTAGERDARPAAPRAGNPASARPAAAADPDQLRILFANDTEARALVGRRVEIRGRLSPETQEEKREATEVIGADAEKPRDTDRERTEDADRPIPQFHAEAIAPAEGACTGASR